MDLDQSPSPVVGEASQSYCEESSQWSHQTPLSQANGSQGQEQELRLRDNVPPGQSRSADKVMDKTRRCIRVDSKVGTDDNEPIDEVLAARALSCAVLLKFQCYNVVIGHDVPYLGQGGFLQNPNNPGDIRFATSRHNLATEDNKKGELEMCKAPHELELHDSSTAEINIPNTGWQKTAARAIVLRDGETWANGFDLSLGPALNELRGEHHWECQVRKYALAQLVPKVRTFEMVSNQFSYSSELKVGIVVLNPGCTNDTEVFSEFDGLHGIGTEEIWPRVAEGVDKFRYEEVLGREGVVRIYTGTITKVGTDHIEYNVNTYKGCSGAIVIVMQRGHPDFGKALAIHAGYQNVLGTNIGFKLAGAFDRVWVVDH